MKIQSKLLTNLKKNENNIVEITENLKIPQNSTPNVPDKEYNNPNIDVHPSIIQAQPDYVEENQKRSSNIPIERNFLPNLSLFEQKENPTKISGRKICSNYKEKEIQISQVEEPIQIESHRKGKEFILVDPESQNSKNYQPSSLPVESFGMLLFTFYLCVILC